MPSQKNLTAMSKERPILFNGQMVRAILEGRKTQTRRIINVNDAGVSDFHTVKKHGGFTLTGELEPGVFQWDCGSVFTQIRCCHGKPGDRLWVREGIYSSRSGWRYDADQQVVDPGLSHIKEFVAWNASQKRNHIPSIHMPRWASRITLEVESVRVERLQDISEGDAMAEGCRLAAALHDCKCVEACGMSFRGGYAKLWESINGPGSWDANPWVWVITFKRITP